MDQNTNLYALKHTFAPEDFSKELDCLSRVKHLCGESILCLVDSFSAWIEGSKYPFDFIVTDYASGFIPLRQFLRDNRITPTEGMTLMQDIEDIISFLHENDIAHGDINSDNILINPDTLKVKLIDFGLCSYGKIDEIEEDVARLALTKNFIKKSIQY